MSQCHDPYEKAEFVVEPPCPVCGTQCHDSCVTDEQVSDDDQSTQVAAAERSTTTTSTSAA